MTDAPNLTSLSPEQKRALLAELLRRKASAPVEPAMSFGQRALWFVYQLDPASSAYNVSVAVRITREVDRAALSRAFAAVMARHASLRSVFRAEGGEPRQTIRSSMEVPLTTVDARDLDDAALHALVTDHHRRPFDLETGPVCRAELFTVAERDSVLLFTAHHIVIDGWSAGIIFDEIQALYAADLSGAQASLPALPCDYAGYVEWQNTMLAETGAQMETYWRAALADPLPVLDLPTDRPRPALQRFRGGAVTFVVPSPVVSGLQQLARREGATLFSVLLAAYFVLLSRYTGQDDVVVGTTALGRSRPEFERIVGYFVNPIALRVSVKDDPSFRDLLGTVGAVVRGGLEHQDFPFPLLVERLQPTRDLSRSPVFQAMFNLLRAQWIGAERGDAALPMRPFTIPQEEGQFDIALDMGESAGQLGAMLRYNSDLFDAETMERVAAHFGALLASAAADPSARVSALTMTSEAERRHLLVTLNDTALSYDPAEGVDAMVTAQALRTPDGVAVRCGERVVRYAELDRESNRLAAYLRERGVAPGVLVGVCLQRSPQLPVALLAVLKAGGAYVPLDPGFPRRRLQLMVEDAALDLILTDEASQSALPDCAARLIRVDGDAATIARSPSDPIAPGATGDDLAYVLYTSGSTGTPKGVQIPRRALTNFIRAMQVRPGLSAHDVLVAVTTLSFDIAGLELYLPLSVGATIVIATREEAADGVALRHLMSRCGATVMQATPATWRMLIDAGWDGSPSLTALCGGEPLTTDLAAQLLQRAGCVWNMYGPTETTIWSTVDRVAAGERITVGRPIGNTQVYVVDGLLRPVPVGIRGEICIGGDGVALGYLGRAELTAERFVADPFSSRSGARVYRTGDLGRWLPDGRLDVLGRADQQVKVRGFRIELGEIEAALDRHEAVRQSVVIVHGEAADQKIVAYVSYHAGKTVTPSELRRALLEALPEYMVPSLFVEVEALPLTPNGKVDRRALPAPAASLATDRTRIPPRTPVESRIAAIWSAVLKQDDVSVHENFFMRGGHSLLAAQVTARMREAFGVELPVRTIFEASTIADLATVVEGLMASSRGADVESAASGQSRSAAPSPHPDVETRADGSGPLSYSQRRLWFFERMEPGTSVFNIPLALHLAGPLEAARVRHALEQMAERHETLRTSFGEREGEPVQVVHESIDLPFSFHDLRLVPPSARQQAVTQAREAASAPFDLDRAPLWRAALVCTGEGEHLLLWTFHHLIADGWSLRVAVRELAALYEQDGAASPPLAPLTLQYRDYAKWQSADEDTRFDRQLEFWRAHLHGPLPVLELPTDAVRTAGPSFTGGTCSATISPELSRRIEQLARAHGATPFMVLCALFQALLARLSGQSDVIVGVPVAGRSDAALEGLIGVFINTLPLRAAINPDQPFDQLLRDARHGTLEALTWQDVPFERIVQAVRPERDLSRTPIFQALFNMFDADPEPIERLGTAAVAVDLQSQDWSSKFDVTLYATVIGAALRFDLVYNAQLFAAERAAEMLRQYLALLEQVVVAPATPIGRLSLATPQARGVLPDPGEPLARTGVASVSARVRGWAQTQGSCVAVTDPRSALTYAELDGRSDRLAGGLRARGARPGDRVAVVAARCAALVPTLLGIWRAGAAFVLIDPAYPIRRLLDCLDVARPVGIVAVDGDSPFTASALEWCRDRGAWCELAQALQSETPSLVTADRHLLQGDDTSPDGLAYLAFTSGTTGRPKAVAGTHAPLSHFFDWHAREFGLGTQDRVSVLSGLSHDPLLRDIFAPLWAGGTAAMPDGDRLLEPGYLGGWIRGECITAAHLTPALASIILGNGMPDGSLPELRALFCGGDRLRLPLAAALHRVAPAARVVNFYGATETPQAIAWNECDPGESERGGEVPIGRGIPDVQLLLVTEAGTLAGVGEPGEICVRTPYLSVGYFEDEPLTRERFVPSPHACDDDDRMYRTGDWGRYLPDGRVQVFGRRDFQVKVRGYRIELSEIDLALCRHPEVAAAVTIARDVESGDAKLVTYFVPGSTAPEERELRAHLRRHLPDYMQPAVLQPLAALPLTANGKIDRRALPEPGSARSSLTPTIDVAPLESALATHPAIERAAATVEQNPTGERRLVVYISYRAGEDATASELRRHVRRELTAIAMPAMFVPLDNLPLTEAGEVDRAALPSQFGTPSRSDRVAARTPSEQAIASVWMDLLKITDLSVYDNFFDVGGHSLLSVQASVRIEKLVGVRINPRLLVVENLEQLAARCDRETAVAKS